MVGKCRKNSIEMSEKFDITDGLVGDSTTASAPKGTPVRHPQLQHSILAKHIARNPIQPKQGKLNYKSFPFSPSLRQPLKLCPM